MIFEKLAWKREASGLRLWHRVSSGAQFVKPNKDFPDDKCGNIGARHGTIMTREKWADFN